MQDDVIAMTPRAQPPPLKPRIDSSPSLLINSTTTATRTQISEPLNPQKIAREPRDFLVGESCKTEKKKVARKLQLFLQRDKQGAKQSCTRNLGAWANSKEENN
jgi:hypothetical protein